MAVCQRSPFLPDMHGFERLRASYHRLARPRMPATPAATPTIPFTALAPSYLIRMQTYLGVCGWTAFILRVHAICTARRTRPPTRSSVNPPPAGERRRACCRYATTWRHYLYGHLWAPVGCNLFSVIAAGTCRDMYQRISAWLETGYLVVLPLYRRLL